MITNTITKNNDRVIRQAIANLTMFGVPQTVAEKSVMNVVKSLTSNPFPMYEKADKHLLAFAEKLGIGLNGETFSEGQIRTTEVIQ